MADAQLSKPTAYIETTVVSYLTAWPSRDVVRLAHQQATRDWWDTRRDSFQLFISELVVTEASAGDPAAAAQRLVVLQSLKLLDITEKAIAVADALVSAKAIPSTELRDALHVGVCAANGVDYLLTWNFKHLANAVLKDRIRQTCEGCGYRAPVICTPEELF
jgi:hypothetical protein